MIGNTFPMLYHAHHVHYRQDIPFWIDLASRQDGPALELGCGTGRVFLALAQSGKPVYGLDNSPEMLGFLQSHLPVDSTLKAHLLLADLTNFRLALRFGSILLPCNTLSTIPHERLESTIANLLAHLRPGGLFAASLPNPAALKRLPARSDAEIEEVFSHPLDGEPVQVSSAWERFGQRFTVWWHYDHLLPDGRVERLSVQTTHYLATLQVYQELFKQAGFKSLETYGDFDYSTYTGDSPQMILIARG